MTISPTLIRVHDGATKMGLVIANNSGCLIHLSGCPALVTCRGTPLSHFTGDIIQEWIEFSAALLKSNCSRICTQPYPVEDPIRNAPMSNTPEALYWSGNPNKPSIYTQIKENS